MLRVECFVALLVFGFIVLLLSGFGVGWGPQGRRRSFQLLTSRFGGAYQSGGVFRRPSVRFRYGPTWVSITAGPKRGTYKTTQAHLQWPDAKTDVRVETRSPWARSLSGHDMSGVPVGDEDFTRRYQVMGHRVEEVRRLLSDGVRWQINKLCQTLDCPYVSFSIRNGRMIVESPAQLRRNEDLEQFTQLCLELFDQAMLTRSEGIEFLGRSDEAQPIEDPICQICGEEIRAEMVFCRRCRTPHHLDCWQYNGCCSTYGCRETRYVVPTVARAIAPRSDDHDRASDTLSAD